MCTTDKKVIDKKISEDLLDCPEDEERLKKMVELAKTKEGRLKIFKGEVE